MSAWFPFSARICLEDKLSDEIWLCKFGAMSALGDGRAANVSMMTTWLLEGHSRVSLEAPGRSQTYIAATLLLIFCGIFLQLQRATVWQVVSSHLFPIS